MYVKLKKESYAQQSGTFKGQNNPLYVRLRVNNKSKKSLFFISVIQDHL